MYSGIRSIKVCDFGAPWCVRIAVRDAAKTVYQRAQTEDPYHAIRSHAQSQNRRCILLKRVAGLEGPDSPTQEF